MILKTLFVLGTLLLAQAQNIFQQPMYVNPTFRKNIQDTLSVTTDATTIRNLQLIQNAPSAFWIDKREKIKGKGRLDTLEGILEDASRSNVKQTLVFIVYDLPNRDCNARASNGELCCTYRANNQCDYLSNTDNCQSGLDQYKREYIDPYVDVVLAYQDKVNIALVIEPDSLPNLVTNMGNPACRNSERVYKEGITYAINMFSQYAPKVWLYLDAAHGGWLGWKDSNMLPFVRLIQNLGIQSKLRGFATNVANYQPIGKMCPQVDWCLPQNNHLSDECCQDPCKLTTQYNGCVNELNYVQLLASYFPDKKFIIDTGRSGVPSARQDCANWGNPRNTGIGQYPTAETGYPMIDAYLWLKTPGESDCCSEILPNGNRCPRFDSMCASVDSIGTRSGEPRAPEAGAWFLYQIQMLARNANLGKIPERPPSPPSPSPSPSPSLQPSLPSPSPSPSPSLQPSLPSPSPSPSLQPSPNNNVFSVGKCQVKCQQCIIENKS